MSKFVILDEANQSAQLVDDTDGHDLTGRAVIEVADSFNWSENAVDWAAGALVQDFAAMVATLHAIIDADASKERCKYISNVVGQDMTYRLKEDEARSWNPLLSSLLNFPYLREESEQTGVAVATLVADIIAAADLWKSINPKIEGARRAAKMRVSNAVTAEDAWAGAVIDWEEVLS